MKNCCIITVTFLYLSIWCIQSTIPTSCLSFISKWCKWYHLFILANIILRIHTQWMNIYCICKDTLFRLFNGICINRIICTACKVTLLMYWHKSILLSLPLGFCGFPGSCERPKAKIGIPSCTSEPWMYVLWFSSKAGTQCFKQRMERRECTSKLSPYKGSLNLIPYSPGSNFTSMSWNSRCDSWHRQIDTSCWRSTVLMDPSKEFQSYWTVIWYVQRPFQVLEG